MMNSATLCDSDASTGGLCRGGKLRRIWLDSNPGGLLNLFRSRQSRTRNRHFLEDIL